MIDQIGAWQLRPFGLESITTNQSEAFNCVLKRLQQWKEAPVDAAVLSLYRLNQFFIAEISRGHSGLGDYVLREGLSSTVPSQTATLQPSNLDDIVDRIQHGDGNIVEVAVTTDGVASDDDVEPSDVPSTSQHQLPSLTSSSDVTRDATVAERAADVIAAGKITLDTKLAVFTVNGTTEPRVVRLFPRATCSCPARARCYHLTAARMAVGLADDQPHRQQLSLTQLRRNTRKRPDKTCGRKRPRLDDVDVVPAGDADPAVTEQLTAAIAVHQPQTSDRDDPAPESVTDIQTDICHHCDLRSPPPRKSKKSRVYNWVGCDQCPRWYHTVCVGVKRTSAPYVCPLCE